MTTTGSGDEGFVYTVYDAALAKYVGQLGHQQFDTEAEAHAAAAEAAGTSERPGSLTEDQQRTRFEVRRSPRRRRNGRHQ